MAFHNSGKLSLGALVLEELKQALAHTLHKRRGLSVKHMTPPPIPNKPAVVMQSSSKENARLRIKHDLMASQLRRHLDPLLHSSGILQQQDYYQRLGVPKDASKEQIREAAQRKVDEIREAYQALYQEEKRKAYDQRLECLGNDTSIEKILVRVWPKEGRPRDMYL